MAGLHALSGSMTNFWRGRTTLQHGPKRKENSGLFVEPDEAVQEAYRRVIEYVMRRYNDNQSRRSDFLTVRTLGSKLIRRWRRAGAITV